MRYRPIYRLWLTDIGNIPPICQPCLLQSTGKVYPPSYVSLSVGLSYVTWLENNSYFRKYHSYQADVGSEGKIWHFIASYQCASQSLQVASLQVASLSLAVVLTSMSSCIFWLELRLQFVALYRRGGGSQGRDMTVVHNAVLLVCPDFKQLL